MAYSESALFYATTEVNQTNQEDKARFVLNVGNSVYVQKAVKIVPHSVWLTNIFPNVNTYRNTYLSDQEPRVTVPVGQYTNTELVTAMNSENVGTHIWSLGDDDYISIQEILGGLDHHINASLEFWQMLGFQQDVELQADGSYTLTLVGDQLLKAQNLPNLGGEKVVFLTNDKMARANLVFSGDSTPYDVFAAISFHDVEYGMTAYYRAADIKVDDIEYKDHNNLDTIVFGLYDSRMRPLPMPSNYAIRAVFKVYHRDAQAGKGRH